MADDIHFGNSDIKDPPGGSLLSRLKRAKREHDVFAQRVHAVSPNRDLSLSAGPDPDRIRLSRFEPGMVDIYLTEIDMRWLMEQFDRILNHG